MNKRTLLILIALVVAAGVVMTLFSTDENGPRTDTELVLPQLADALNNVSQISVLRGGNKTIATLVRDDDGWTVSEAGGYPANLGRIRKNLIALSKARVIEEKTAKPELHPRLGVEDIQLENAAGTLLKIEGIDTEPVAVIIGQTGIGGGSMSYARRVDEDQSLMISAEMDLGSSISDWLDRQVLNISSGEIFAVTVTGADDDAFRIEKAIQDGTDFELIDKPEDRELAYAGVTNALGAVLSDLELDNVEAERSITLPEAEPVISKFEMYDGLVIESRAWKTEDGTRVKFSASANEELATRFREEDNIADDKSDDVTGEKSDDTADEKPTEIKPAQESAQNRADQINARLADWVYTLPGFKADQLTKTMDDLLKPVDP